jgi:pentatricopeptide repeat protein
MFWRRAIYRTLSRQPPIVPQRVPKRTLSSYFDSNQPKKSNKVTQHSRRTHAVPTVDLDGLVSQLNDALRAKDPAQVRSVFMQFFQDPTSFSPSSITLSSTVDRRQVIVSSLRKLAMTNDVKFLARVVATFDRAGVEADEVTHTAILQGLQARDLSESVLWWLQNTSTALSAGPRIEWWNAHLAECIRLQRPELFERSVNALRQCTKPRPDHETYRLIFKHMLAEHSTALPAHELQTWVDQMGKDGVPFSRALFDDLISEFTRAGAVKSVITLEQAYLMAPHAEGKETLCAERLASMILDAGDTSAHKLFLQFKETGFVPTSTTLDIIADALTSPTALQKWERWLGVNASPTAWESFMTRLASGGQWRDMHSAYRQALEQGRQPTPGMLHPVLRTLCSKPSRPTDADIMKALELFYEYLRVTSSGDGSKGRMMPAAQEDLPLYNTLLRALIHSSSSSHHETARSLLAEVRLRGIDLDHMAVTSYIIVLMKISTNTQAAFKVYQLLHKRADGQYVLDQKGYVAVLNAYCNLGWKGGPALVASYMTMLKDMRMAGHDIPAEAYTILLRQLALMASKTIKDAGELLEQLVVYIKRVHNTLSLDPTLTPDIALWNQLMDTYQRAGCFNEAFTIWETMYASGRFDNVTISVVLDACSFAGYCDKGRNIMRRVGRSGFPLNEHNWSTWIECLCRHKKFDEAMRTMCIEMPETAGINPSQQMVRLVLRFAKGLQEERALHKRMQRELPEVYAEIKRYESE